MLTPAERLADAQSVILPYALVAMVLLVLAIVIARFPLPAMGSSATRLAKEERKKHSLWAHRNLVFGIPAIFIYLIAEIGVANLFVNFVSQPDIANLTHEQAGRYLSFLWGGMMVGRFVGSAIMARVMPHRSAAPSARILSASCGWLMRPATSTTEPVACFSLAA